jgi:hypothetical protein
MNLRQQTDTKTSGEATAQKVAWYRNPETVVETPAAVAA